MKRNQINKYTGELKRSSAEYVDYASSPNPYIAIVTNHLDSTFMGGLEVQLQTKTASGNPKNQSGSFYKVRYLSPFYGVSPLAGIQPNDGHEYSQKSYGMWFAPPDIGSKVLVIFAEGGEAFWIGCIPEQDTNFMMPAGDVTTTFHKDENNTTSKLPVGELNKAIDDNSNGNATGVQKPVNTDQVSSLTTRGLIQDETRGLTTSSSRRETPSAVFGISTPGPHDRRPDAPKVPYGNAEVYHNRLGGSSLVMDDGDATLTRKGSPGSSSPEYADKKAGDNDGDVTIPHNEMLRLKTRTGHQILMHNSEDLIYIGNSRGTAWVELTSNGKIDIYSEDSISVRTAQDLNFKADRDINFQADRDCNIKAKKNINFEAEQEDFKLLVGGNNKITTNGKFDISTTGNNIFTTEEGSTEINSSGSNLITAGDNTEIKSGGDHIESTGGKILMNGPKASEATEAEKARALTTWNIAGAGSETIMRRVPSREPWLSHENLAPLNFTPTETDIKKPEEQRGQGITSFPPNEGEYKFTADTFRKGT